MVIRASMPQAQALGQMEFSLGVVAWAELGPAWRSRGLSAPFNRLYLVESGSGTIWTEGQTVKMEPGMAYLLPAGQPCSYDCGDFLNKLFIHFNLYKPDRYDVLWGSREIGCIPLAPGTVSQLRSCLEEGDLLGVLEIQQTVMSLLLRHLRGSGWECDLGDPYSPDVADTIGYIRKNLSARLKVTELARRRFVSRTHLTEAFRRETGITLGRYIDDQLILEAQRRLSQTDQPVGDISRELGFCDQFYFSRRFTQLSGMTPLQYRQSFR